MKQSVVLLFLFVIGCAVEPKIPTGPLSSVSGHAFLYSDKGMKLEQSEDITVTADGTGITTKTDDDGNWTMKGLPEGNYVFTFSKPGFGSVKIFNFKTVGKDTNCEEEIDMSQPTSDLINFQRFTAISSSLDSIPSYNIIGAMQPPFLKIRSVVLCISADSVALAHDPTSAPVQLPFVIPGSGYDGGFDWGSTSAFSANEKTFARGTRIYATVSISGEGPDAAYFSNYYDPTLGRRVFTALGGHSQILSDVMP